MAKGDTMPGFNPLDEKGEAAEKSRLKIIMSEIKKCNMLDEDGMPVTEQLERIIEKTGATAEEIEEIRQRSKEQMAQMTEMNRQMKSEREHKEQEAGEGWGLLDQEEQDRIRGEIESIEAGRVEEQEQAKRQAMADRKPSPPKNPVQFFDMNEVAEARKKYEAEQKQEAEKKTGAGDKIKGFFKKLFG